MITERHSGYRFTFEYELRARHPRGVLARLDPYESYYWSPAPEEDHAAVPRNAVRSGDRDDVEDTYVRTAARMTRMSLPILVSCIACSICNTGILGPFMASTVGAGVPATSPVRI